MTDSTINTNSSDGTLDVGAATDDLFEDLEEGIPEGEPVDGDATDESESTADERKPSEGGVEDQTAATVFGNLQNSDAASDDIDGVLEGESPEDIIASADEPEPAADDSLVDEDALEEMLLTDRTKEREFLWIDADDDAETDTSAADDDAGPSVADTVEPEAETDTPAEPAAGDDPRPAVSDSSVSEPAADSVETDSAVASIDDAEPIDAKSGAVDPDTGTQESASSDDVDDQQAPAATDDSEETAATVESEPAADREAEADGDHETGPTRRGTDKQTGTPATTDDDNGSAGVLGWLRSTLGRLFS
ncbi:hypothetical protein [Natronorubrum sulfidifaciens]|uniref:Uncharacterized protein n=1 Tax=Natronorubrum sulfidifaciens JCM 14089 TaxID=1230460 RepID=L9W2D6_9EURY|nr:hypothetical protein [Natronorubrum sulfidifaciens]ELY42478.1 hypothetical protein C495_14212 [Natronorubrum sulfidifaciens JCM 14089]